MGRQAQLGHLGRNVAILKFIFCYGYRLVLQMRGVMIDDERSEETPVHDDPAFLLPSPFIPSSANATFSLPVSQTPSRLIGPPAPSFSSSTPKPFLHYVHRPPNPPYQLTLKHYAKLPRISHQPCSFDVSLTSGDRRACLCVQSPFRECRAGSGGRGRGSLLDVDGQ
jgi:hypothetical protein